jgi:rhamnosyltransferase
MTYTKAKLNHTLSIAIVVTFNPDIKEFTEFFKIIIGQFSNVLIVDNNSDNLSSIIDIVNNLQNHNKIKFIYNDFNKGLSNAQNQGVKYAIENMFESFCMFDQDSKIDSRYLISMINEYNDLTQKVGKIGSLGPTIVDQTTGNAYPAVRYNGFFLNRIQINNESIKCSYIIASGSLTDISIFQNVGWFNDNFFINYIDVEWCFRAISKGFEIYITPKVKLYQNVGISRKIFLGRAIPIHSPLRRYYASRNSTLMLKLKHVSIGYKIREIIFNPIRLIFDCIVAGDTKIRIKLFIKGFVDGIKKR